MAGRKTSWTLTIIALGGIPNKARVGDMGIDGRIYPVSSVPRKSGEAEGSMGAFQAVHGLKPVATEQSPRPGLTATAKRASSCCTGSK